MEFLFKVVLLVSAAAAALYYFSSIRVRELAIMAAQKHCQTLGVQLLDQSVSLKKVRLTKNTTGNLTIGRTYHFEFTSTGEERYHGNISMQSNRAVTINLQPHRMPENPEAPLAYRTSPSSHQDN